MKKLNLAAVALIPVSQILLTTSAFAQRSYTTYETTSSDDAAGAAVASLVLSSFFLCYCVFIIIMLALSIWMIVWTYKDAQKRNNPNAVLWAVLVFFFGLIPFIVYLFVRKDYPLPEESQTKEVKKE